jgi:hypothetical protein
VNVTGASADVNEFGGNLNFVSWIPTPTAGLIRPYLTAGPDLRARGGESDGRTRGVSLNRWGFNAGGGIQFTLGGLGARIDARYRRLSREPDDFTYIR